MTDWRYPRVTQDPDQGSVYVYLAEQAPVARTVELVADRVLADYAEDGRLLGIEIP